MNPVLSCSEKARKLAEAIAQIDFDEFEDSLYLKFGGDGDNGEFLVDVLTVFFSRGGDIS